MFYPALLICGGVLATVCGSDVRSQCERQFDAGTSHMATIRLIGLPTDANSSVKSNAAKLSVRILISTSMR